MTKRVVLYSSVALEPWDWTNPWTKGIGGSETSHIELAERLGARYQTTSYAPCIGGMGPSSVPWYPVELINEQLNAPAVWLVYRDPSFFDRELDNRSRYWFIAQDVDYDWTEARLAKVHRYVCLCQEHVDYTLAKYPSLRGRTYLSTNGIRSAYLNAHFETDETDDEVSRTEDCLRDDKLIRQPNRLFYASSPDRGLLLILQNWFRIRERVPDAELRIAYGFDNMESILARNNGQAGFLAEKNEIESLLNQPGVTWLGRLPQHDVYREWFQANCFFYPTNWPETSCISLMEAQACGAFPVTNAYWAMKQNTLGGVLIDGVPQDDATCRSIMIRELCELMLESPARLSAYRDEMVDDARASFDWDRIVNEQLVPWLDADFEAMRHV